MPKLRSPHHIARLMRAARAAHGLSQRDVCEAIGISRQAFSMWERGVSTPSLARLFQWADAVGVELSGGFDVFEPPPTPRTDPFHSLSDEE